MTTELQMTDTRQLRGRGAVGRAFDRDQPCFVYLAAHSAGQRFKIGVSIDPLARFQQLPEAAQIDLTVTLVLRLSSQARAQQVERALHKALAPFRIPAQHGLDGYTEWFQMEAFARAALFMDLVPDAVAPAETLKPHKGDQQRNRYARLAELNVGKTVAALSLWRLTASRMALSVHEEGRQRWLLIRDFRPSARHAATGTRAALMDIEGSYGLRSLGRGAAMPSLVRLLSYVGPDSRDLRIDLQCSQVLSRLPGGSRIVQCLQDGLGALRLESRARRPCATPLTEQQITDGFGRLLEPRLEDMPLTPSLWE